MVEVVAFTGTLTHAGEYGITAVLDGDVADQLHQRHGFTHASTAEQADFAALGDRHDQVDDLDAGFQDVVTTCLLFVGRRLAVNRHALFRTDRAGLIDGPAQHVHHPAEGLLTHRHRNGVTGIGHFDAAFQAIGGAQRNRAHHAVTQLLLHFQRDLSVVHRQGVKHLGHGVTRELHVDDSADDLND